MPNLYEIVQRLIDSDLRANEQRLAIKDFTHHFGWTPSDSIETLEMGYAQKHIVVEHGLENSAVISFLKRPFSSLSTDERQRLLNVSYNNLVDWHVQIEREQVTFVYNRTEPERIVEQADWRAIKSTFYAAGSLSRSRIAPTIYHTCA